MFQGVVAITAGADQMGSTNAILVRATAGTLIVFAVSFIDKLRLDEPVVAIAVRLICGIWGILAVDIFGSLAGINQFISQLTRIRVSGVFCVITSFIILLILKKAVGIRVSEREQIERLDVHGMDAYPDFRLNECYFLVIYW